ncbi:GNAT family N-acetyltransferase [filamentous cyanobacterium CCP2]|nr:GNAT family N-acetyltransferase [filamentous cyanobacterium CCP2]
MQLHRFDHIQAFYDRSQTYLLQHEAEHNLLLGISHTLLNYPDRYPNPPYLVTVEQSGEIVAIAMRTPPHKLLLSKARNLDALALIAQDVHRMQENLPGVGGLVRESQIFMTAWQAFTRQPYELTLAMRIHQLTQVQPVIRAKGNLRLATPSDRPLLVKWYQAFLDEVKVLFAENAERIVDSSLKRQTAYIWEDSVPVSFACGSQSLPTAGRIGPVYTPPAYRQKGYATACVATLSQRLLDQGCQRCFLFTDLANPTSNHIYQTIGYVPVCDWNDYTLM